MDREMQLRLNEPYFQANKNPRLTEFPLDDQFINPGIGVQMYDFYVPLHGKEDYELKKKTEALPGSFSEKSSDVIKNLKNDLKQQEGFGVIDSLPSSSQTLSKKRGLDSDVLSAMKFATIKTNQITYVPKTKKIQKEALKSVTKKSLLKDKFKLI